MGIRKIVIYEIAQLIEGIKHSGYRTVKGPVCKIAVNRLPINTLMKVYSQYN